MLVILKPNGTKICLNVGTNKKERNGLPYSKLQEIATRWPHRLHCLNWSHRAYKIVHTLSNKLANSKNDSNDL